MPMASFVGEHESCECLSPFPNISGDGGDDEESLLTSYGGVPSKFDFTGIQTFQRCCERNYRDYRDGSSNCNEYLLFNGVTLEHMSMVDTTRRSLPKMCCHYDAGEEVLIVKLMVGFNHEYMSRQFFGVLRDKLTYLGLRIEFIPCGSGRFGGNRRHKEADESFKPRSTRPAKDDWPTMTVELRFSESLPQLQLDARFWLTQCLNQLRTNIVILIHINVNERKIDIERWEVVDSRRQLCANVQYLSTIACVQSIKLSKGNVYTGPPLELCIEKLFDIVPPNLAPGAFDYTVAESQYLNDEYWM